MTATNKQDWSNAPKHGILIHNDAKGLRVRLRRPVLPYAPSRKQDLQEVFAMLDQAFQQVYTKFKLHFYQQVFSKFENREATLTTVESFCMEVIMALGHPTIAEFSNMMNLSTPNAAYKINNLVKKGYVKKVRSTTDKREYYLYPTRKYVDYYSISYAYLQQVVDRAKQRFSPDELQKLEEMLKVVSEELMPEIKLPAGGPATAAEPQP